MRTIAAQLPDEPISPVDIRLHRFGRAIGALVSTAVTVNARRSKPRLAAFERQAGVKVGMYIARRCDRTARKNSSRRRALHKPRDAPLDERQPVLPPEDFPIDQIARRPEHARGNRRVGVLLVSRGHLGSLRGLDQRQPVQSDLVAQRLQYAPIRDIAVVAPDRAQDRM